MLQEVLGSLESKSGLVPTEQNKETLPIPADHPHSTWAEHLIEAPNVLLIYNLSLLLCIFSVSSWTRTKCSVLEDHLKLNARALVREEVSGAWR